jgi:hypothetical protein
MLVDADAAITTANRLFPPSDASWCQVSHSR